MVGDILQITGPSGGAGLHLARAVDAARNAERCFAACLLHLDDAGLEVSDPIAVLVMDGLSEIATATMQAADEYSATETERRRAG